MTRVPITVMGFRCDRCGHEWIPRGEVAAAEPKVCPKCKSPYWNRPRKNAAPMTYESFRNAVRSTLAKGPPDGMTWTDIRTTARLPQAFPNNHWVRRMESDIGLRRERDAHSILHWQLPSEVPDGQNARDEPAN